MVKIDIVSGFLGAGKTTLIKKLLTEAFSGEKVVLIENEFGEIGIDGGFLKEAGVEITEMNSGCICCSLVGDFGKALSEVLSRFSPDRILIEPSGVGKLSDIIKAVENLDNPNIFLNSYSAVVDAKKCRLYMKNFGEFFCNQIEHAKTIILSRTDTLPESKLGETIELIRKINADAEVIATPWTQLTGAQILSAMEQCVSMEKTLAEEVSHHCHEESPAQHEHDASCTCPACSHGTHEHEHEHEKHCDCHDEHGHEHGHEHHHHHDHHADEIFTSVGFETVRTYTEEEIRTILGKLENPALGTILRAKGIVSAENRWIYFDFVPGEADIRFGAAETIGKVCVIGSKIQKEALQHLFGV